MLCYPPRSLFGEQRTLLWEQTHACFDFCRTIFAETCTWEPEKTNSASKIHTGLLSTTASSTAGQLRSLQPVSQSHFSVQFRRNISKVLPPHTETRHTERYTWLSVQGSLMTSLLEVPSPFPDFYTVSQLFHHMTRYKRKKNKRFLLQQDQKVGAAKSSHHKSALQLDGEDPPKNTDSFLLAFFFVRVKCRYVPMKNVLQPAADWVSLLSRLTPGGQSFGALASLQPATPAQPQSRANADLRWHFPPPPCPGSKQSLEMTIRVFRNVAIPVGKGGICCCFVSYLFILRWCYANSYSAR